MCSRLLSLAERWLFFSSRFHTVFPFCPSVLISSSQKEPSHTGLWLPPLTSLHLDFLFQSHISKSSHILRNWGQDFDNIKSGGDTIQLLTMGNLICSMLIEVFNFRASLQNYKLKKSIFSTHSIFFFLPWILSSLCCQHFLYPYQSLCLTVLSSASLYQQCYLS